MNDIDTKKDSGGVRFPFISLEKAVGRAEELFKADPNGREMLVGTAFGVWNYSEKSSGGHQTIGALKMYGLINDEGSNNARKIALTSAALRYFKDEREEERLKCLQGFALSPKLISSLWQIWKDEPPADTVARSHLKVERGLNEQASRSLLGIYKDNLMFAQLKGSAKIPEVQENLNQNTAIIKIGDYVQWTSAGVDQFPIPRRVDWVSDDNKYVRVEGSQAGIPMNETTKTVQQPFTPPVNPINPPPPPPMAGTRRAVFALAEGDVVINFPEDLSPESVADLADYLEIFMKKAKREAGIN